MEPLYCSRKLLKSDEFVNWMIVNNIIDKIEPEDLHLTVAYSTNPVNWDDIVVDKYMLLVPRHARKLKLFGTSLVLSINSKYLENRWNYYLDMGCSWDFPDYQAHISLSYNYKSLPSNIEPFQGDILLGPEMFKNINEGDNNE